MLVLDTDHLSALDRHGDRCRLYWRLDASAGPVATTIVSAEELMRGWLSQIHRLHDPHLQIAAYRRLDGLFSSLQRWTRLQWTEDAANVLNDLQGQRLRIGTMDLKIASIVLSQPGAMLLSRNLRDFERVPGLRVENWID